MQAAIEEEMTVEVKSLSKAKPSRGPPGCSPFFAAISDVMFAAKKMKLEPEDLLELQPSDEVTMIGQKMHGRWAAEVARSREEAARAAESGGDQQHKKQARPPSLLRALWPLVGGLWRRAFFSYVFSVALSFVGPLVLSMAISAIERTQLCGIAEQAIAAGLITNYSSPAEVAATLRADSNAIVAEPPPVSAACRESNQIYMGYVFAAIMLGSKLTEAVAQAWHAHLMTHLSPR